MGKAFGFGLFVLLGCFDWLLGGGAILQAHDLFPNRRTRA